MVHAILTVAPFAFAEAEWLQGMSFTTMRLQLRRLAAGLLSISEGPIGVASRSPQMLTSECQSFFHGCRVALFTCRHVFMQSVVCQGCSRAASLEKPIAFLATARSAEAPSSTGTFDAAACWR